ncbi:hypothetical protein [Roseibium sediminicola]|uniref:Tetratricopeptide repeat protein n=1 Tax=Roseibium sediminicola TaxID=2933272 RepID=A0ABT0GMP1_9HYPH|nr:hypothetical protein [Roseibium sp. CAU 1639]MCK7610687.1 hypothetical protein [Roseibium sp. CAU 1639]
MKRVLAAVLLSVPLFCAPRTVQAYDCGAHAYETSRQYAPGKVRLSCRCNPGYLLHEKICAVLDVTREALEHLTGDAFKLGHDLRVYAEARSNAWSATHAAAFLMAVAKAETGDFDGAQGLMKRLALDLSPPEPVVDKMIHVLAGFSAKQTMKPHEHLPDVSREIDLLANALAGDAVRTQPAYQARMRRIDQLLIEGAYLRNAKDLDAALQAVAEAAELNETLDDLIRTGSFGVDMSNPADVLATARIQDTLLLLRALARQRDEKSQSPDVLKARSDKSRRKRAAVAAWDLANEADGAVSETAARALSREAIEQLLGLDPSGQALERKMMENDALLLLPEERHAFCCAHLDGDSSTTLLLQSLEFGNGNWDRSHQFLRAVRKVYPKDPMVGEALARLNAFRSTGADLKKDP